jgi:hypothetical protein
MIYRDSIVQKSSKSKPAILKKKPYKKGGKHNMTKNTILWARMHTSGLEKW